MTDHPELTFDKNVVEIYVPPFPEVPLIEDFTYTIVIKAEFLNSYGTYVI